jgi:hypothetical protein
MPGRRQCRSRYPHALQNQAKNNLCASGNAVEATFTTFKNLQAQLVARNIANWSPNSLPPDRSIFKNLYTTSNGNKLGEGSLVKLVAYVMKVKKGGKESVNCGKSKTAFIDFHVVLVPTKTSTECASVTAEVIPHFRPTAWSAAGINTPDVPMRFTGQLRRREPQAVPERGGEGGEPSPSRDPGDSSRLRDRRLQIRFEK